MLKSLFILIVLMLWVTLLMLSSGCQSSTCLNPALVDGTFRRIVARDAAYIAADPTLTQQQKDNDQRDGALVLKVLDTAETNATTQP